MKKLLGMGVCFCLAAFVAEAVQVTRVMMPERYAPGDVNVHHVQVTDDAAWIWKAGEPDGNLFLLFRKAFSSDGKTCRIHVSADERFVLSLDGQRIARGPDRGTVERWTYQSYDLALAPGQHTLEAVVWRVGDAAPIAQLSWYKSGGFLLKAEGTYDGQLTTGKATWQVARLPDVKWHGMGAGTFGIGQQIEITGTSPLFAKPAESAFVKPVPVARGPLTDSKYGGCQLGWKLFPSALPDQLDIPRKPGAFLAAVNGKMDSKTFYRAQDASHPACAAWNKLLQKGEAVTVPADTEMCLLWDLGDYFCAYPEMQVEGGAGATVTWGWAEGLFDARHVKGNRNEFAGKHFIGVDDTFRPDGGSCGFALPWWRSGKWCRIAVKTAGKPLTIKSIALFETFYPTPISSSFVSEDASLEGVQKICRRGMQMCSHEMGFDCPYYEQQMYPGDTRIQLLIQYVIFSDDRLARRDIELFDFSRREDGRVGMNFPTRGTQESWTYTLIWPLMLGDYTMWRDNAAWLKERLPGLRHTMAGLKLYENADGLLANLSGWNFMDGVSSWPVGVSPDGDKLNSLNNLFYMCALKDAALVERVVGDPEIAALYEKQAKDRGEKIVRTFWDEKRGMLADTLAKDKFSEHAQCLALLLDILPQDKARQAQKALLEATDLARCTVYFAHYLFDAYAKLGRTDLILKRFDLWRDFVKDNLCAPPESSSVYARSDCHAWDSHPLYHLHANIAGVKPAEPFFKSVLIAPQPASLKTIKASTPHPKGMIVENLSFEGGNVSGTVTLPAGVSGAFEWRGKRQPLTPGNQKISL